MGKDKDMTGKKRIFLLAAGLILLALPLGCGQTGVQESSRYREEEASGDDTLLQAVEQGEVSLSNDRLTLQMDASTTHFTIQDHETGARYQSAVTEELTGAQIPLDERSRSELVVSYYDPESQKMELNSSQHSVAYGNYRVLTDGEAIRVYYTLQLLATPPFAPQILSEGLFEEISGNLSSTDMFKVKLMYKYYPAGSATAEAKEVQARYPYAKDHGVYVLGNLSEADRMALNKYIEGAGYSGEQYQADLQELGIVLDEEELPMQFTVPVEYRLTETGFSAEVLSDRIASANSQYTLYSVSVLPSFHCGVVAEEEGFFLLPDGSGSVMQLAPADNGGYTQRIYGNDPSCRNQLSAVIGKNAVLPLWGYSSSRGSWLGLIEGSAAAATVNASRAGNTEYIGHGGAEFALRATDSYVMRKSTLELAIFAPERNVERPLVEYVLLQPGAGIWDMADCYRSRLVEEGKIVPEGESQRSLYLEFTGYVTEPASFLGISYDKKVVLSTLAEIYAAVEALKEEGVDHIQVRLRGYGREGGLYHGLTEGFSLAPEVGTMEELTALAELLHETGGGLYLEDDILEVYRDEKFDGFSSTSDAVRRLDKTLADVSDFNLVTGKDEDHQYVRYLVSPKLYESLATDFSGELWKKQGTEHMYGSLAGAGQLLVSDFSEQDAYDRTQTIGALLASLELLGEGRPVMCDVGNAYVLGHVDHILNMPLSDSGFPSESFSVPFYQLVLQGSTGYAGEAFNMARNPDKARFDSLLSGADPCYSCVTDKAALESLGQYQRKQPVAFTVVYTEILDFWREHQELAALRAKGALTDYQILSEGLYLLEYGDTAVIFNETGREAEWKGISVEAGGYEIVRGWDGE